MNQDRLHILITGEQGQGRSFAICKNTASRTAIAVVAIFFVLFAGSIAGIKYFSQNLNLTSKNSLLDAQLAETMTVLDEIQANRSNLIAKYEKNIARLEKDREELLEGSISRLNEKNKIIEKVMDQIGVEVTVEEDPNHSGGPFIPWDEHYGNQVLLKADRYLEELNKIPLGQPVPGKISSKYGRRSDPFTQKAAFHSGVDFRGHTGDDVKATADAVVKISSSNDLLGKYIILSHSNGYETSFLHLQKRLVKKGDIVKRGQVIGLIGKTGRSKGSHLHYGIRYNKKRVDPMKYLQVADLSFRVAK